MESAIVDQTSERFLGQWKRLVSTTNWEKGQIISQWREAMAAGDAPPAHYSDEAWSRRVGNVTPQHVGRLRRVFERFGDARHTYEGLYWSHFQAALDWDDAEMWLQGAVDNNWSISEMRHRRWETLGALVAEQPREDDPGVQSPWDDDADASGEVTTGTLGVVDAPQRPIDGPREFEDTPAGELGNDARADDDAPSSYESREAAAAPPVRPFAALPPLPPDVNDAFEAYKLCILRHKLADWLEISRDDLLASLDALKQLALAPREL